MAKKQTSTDSKYDKLCLAREYMRGIGVFNTWKHLWKDMLQVTDEGCDAIIASYIKKAERIHALHPDSKGVEK